VHRTKVYSLIQKTFGGVESVLRLTPEELIDFSVNMDTIRFKKLILEAEEI